MFLNFFYTNNWIKICILFKFPVAMNYWIMSYFLGSPAFFLLRLKLCNVSSSEYNFLKDLTMISVELFTLSELLYLHPAMIWRQHTFESAVTHWKTLLHFVRKFSWVLNFSSYNVWCIKKEISCLLL